MGFGSKRININGDGILEAAEYLDVAYYCRIAQQGRFYIAFGELFDIISG